MQNADNEKYLIVGLGNPGKEYERTRHNVGFYILDCFAKTKGILFQKAKKALVAKWKNVFLLKPQTYMNLSGICVAQFLRFYKIPLNNLLVIVDDACIAFRSLRLRDQGSSGGHNGLGNIQDILQTKSYPRLRIGVGPPQDSDMAGHVLGMFTKQEQQELVAVAQEAVQAIELWLVHGIIYAMNKINVHPKK